MIPAAAEETSREEDAAAAHPPSNPHHGRTGRSQPWLVRTHVTRNGDKTQLEIPVFSKTGGVGGGRGVVQRFSAEDRVIIDF